MRSIALRNRNQSDETGVITRCIWFEVSLGLSAYQIWICEYLSILILQQMLTKNNATIATRNIGIQEKLTQLSNTILILNHMLTKNTAISIEIDKIDADKICIAILILHLMLTSNSVILTTNQTCHANYRNSNDNIDFTTRIHKRTAILTKIIQLPCNSKSRFWIVR